VRIMEISLVGFRIAHETRYSPGDTHKLVMDWDGTHIEADSSIIRSTIFRLAKTSSEKTLYHSGLRIERASDDHRIRLRELIAERIIRAIEEQKANAHGVPPLAAYMYQPGKGDLYRCCELVNGVWRKRETSHPEQPAIGFTISADIDSKEVELLCRTWENTTNEGRRLTQLLAELSISKMEGVPVRRYEP
jgi:hypothetical protein